MGTSRIARVPRTSLAGTAWLAFGVLAIAFPSFVGNAYYLSTAVTALIFVALAVSFDFVVGWIGALSLAQPLFFGFGVYTAGLLNVHYGTSYWIEAPAAIVGAALLALAVGIPSFRLSLHSFAIGTLGFAVIGELVAQNWIGLTRGPLCVTPVAPLHLPFAGGGFTAITLTQQYYAILAIAALIVGIGFWLGRSRLGMLFSSVRDDPTLASARGLSPTAHRLGAFALSASCSALAGTFAAHFQGVVCPTSLGFPYMSALLIMVFIGGRTSLRGVVLGAILFTAVPQLLRMADEWRLVIYGAILLAVVTTFPDGLEQLMQGVTRRARRLTPASRRGHEGDDAAPTPAVPRRATR